MVYKRLPGARQWESRNLSETYTLQIIYTRGPGGEEEGLRVGGPSPVVVGGDHHLVLTRGLERVEHVAAGLQRRRRRAGAEDLQTEVSKFEYVAAGLVNQGHFRASSRLSLSCK